MARDRAVHIRNDLLRAMIGIKLEGGVSSAQVRVLEKFIGDMRQCDPTETIASYLWVEDIPHERREAFLTAVAALSPSADGRLFAF